MKLTLRKFFRYDCFDELMEAIIEKRTPIEFACKLDSRIKDFEFYVLGLFTIVANLFESPRFFASSRYELLSDVDLINEIKTYFAFNNKKNIHSLSCEDYISIANMRFPDKYDRCVVLKVNCNLPSHCSSTLVCRIVVGKNIELSSDQSISYEDICELQKNNSIQIISITSSSAEARRYFLQENSTEHWLAFCERADNQWYKYYASYVEAGITPELFLDCLKAYIKYCDKIFELPSDDFMLMRIKNSDEYRRYFRNSSPEDVLIMIKDFVNNTNILNEAKDILKNHSAAYKAFIYWNENLMENA